MNAIAALICAAGIAMGIASLSTYLKNDYCLIAPTAAMIEYEMSHILQKSNASAIAVAVIDQAGTTLYSKGTKSVTDATPINTETIFEIGSATKTFTGIALASLVADKKIALEDPVNMLIDQLHCQSPISFAELADHSSGLPVLPANFTKGSFDVSNPYANYSVSDLQNCLAALPTITPAQKKYLYSNLGMGLLGYALAIINKSDYQQLLEKYILQPLGMHDTSISFSQRMKDNLALGHNQGEIVPNWDIITLAGAGGLRSSIKDMSAYLAANIYGTTSNNLNSAIALSHQPRITAWPGQKVGLGWHIETVKGHTMIWHNGGTKGYRSFIGFDAEKKRGIVVLINSGTADTDRLGRYLLAPAIYPQHATLFNAPFVRKLFCSENQS